MFLPIIALVIGFVGLILSSDKFSEAGEKLGHVHRVSPLIIGILVFGFGTSAPEIMVSGFAAWSDNNEIGLGNAFGSNIFNITLVLGVSAIIAPVVFAKQYLQKEYVALVIITAVLGVLVWDRYLSLWDGCILLVLFAVFLFIMFRGSHAVASESHTITDSKTKVYLTALISVIILVASANMVVYGAEHIALSLGVSELIIGLTIVSLGTSLPELALAIASSLKKQHEMLIGNIIGSNIFNSTIVLSAVALINPSTIPQTIITRDLPFVAVATLLIILLSMRLRSAFTMGRLGGILLLAFGGVYLYTLIDYI